MKIRINPFALVSLCFFIIFCSGMSSIEGCNTEEEPVAFVSAIPTDGSTIEKDATIVVTFDAPPSGLDVIGGKFSLSGANVEITGPFAPGTLNLILTWADGATGLAYTVEEPKPEFGEVLMYEGEYWWIDSLGVEIESFNAQSLLEAEGITVEKTARRNRVREWMLQTMRDDVVDVLILFGAIPDTIYPPGNTLPDGSVAEDWLETRDGNVILNHADYAFWGGQQARNREGGLQNIMDIPGITMWDPISMKVTADGREFTPSLVDFRSDRPFHLDELQGDWFPEKIFASATGDTRATRADPVIVRDGNRGRIAIVHQTQNRKNPKGKVAAEIIINYLQHN